MSQYFFCKPVHLKYWEIDASRASKQLFHLRQWCFVCCCVYKYYFILVGIRFPYFITSIIQLRYLQIILYLWYFVNYI